MSPSLTSRRKITKFLLRQKTPPTIFGYAVFRHPVERPLFADCEHTRGGSPSMNDPKPPLKKAGLSRRAFLKGSGVAAAATALGQSTLPSFPAVAGEAPEVKDV